jgi:hypothetical protein
VVAVVPVVVVMMVVVPLTVAVVLAIAVVLVFAVLALVMFSGVPALELRHVGLASSARWSGFDARRA